MTGDPAATSLYLSPMVALLAAVTAAVDAPTRPKEGEIDEWSDGIHKHGTGGRRLNGITMI